jgi:hypothetical protein
MSYTSKALVFPMRTLFLLEEWQDFRKLCAAEVFGWDGRVDVVASVFAEGADGSPWSAPYVTSAYVAERFEVSIREVRAVMRKMVDARVIHRVGPGYLSTAVLSSDPFVESTSGQAGVLTSGPFHFRTPEKPYAEAVADAQALKRRVH